jgi:hydroxymethylpyrimidine/phosphomethylpyrimidine kinase
MTDRPPVPGYAANRRLLREAVVGVAPPIALTIAGFDPSGGAGITADLKTFAAHRIYGVACISALTIQSTQGVRGVEPTSPETVRRTLECLADDLTLDGVKIGMLGTAGVVAEVASFLKRHTGSQGVRLGRSRVVLDPVLVSTSGAALLDSAGLQLLVEELLGSVGWITPNRAELAVLIGSGAVAKDEIPAAARRLQELALQQGNRELHVVVTGGDLEHPNDYLLPTNGKEQWLDGTRVKTTSTHGTGCAFSSALLCSLIAGKAPADAARTAKTFVAEALRSAYPVGKGKGPPNHLFNLKER